MEKLNKRISIFSGTTSIVTGGASGIGRALAEELARRGSEVVIADLQIELAKEVASKICNMGGKAKAFEVDVTNFPAVEHLVHETIIQTGRLDYLFNNAGITMIGSLIHYRIEDWNQIIDTNLRGVINGIQASYKIMINQGFGHIVNTSSISGLMSSPATIAYTTSKYGVVGLSKSLRAQTESKGIRVSVLCPGVIRTPLLMGGKYGKLLIDIPPDRLLHMWEKSKPMSPDLFAKKALDLIAKNKAIIIIPSWWKIFWWIDRISPSLGIITAQIIAKKRAKLIQGELGVE